MPVDMPGSSFWTPTSFLVLSAMPCRLPYYLYLWDTYIHAFLLHLLYCRTTFNFLPTGHLLLLLRQCEYLLPTLPFALLPPPSATNMFYYPLQPPSPNRHFRTVVYCLDGSSYHLPHTTTACFCIKHPAYYYRSLPPASAQDHSFEQSAGIFLLLGSMPA